MARPSRRVLASVLLLIISAATWVQADDDDNEAVVETVEVEEQDFYKSPSVNLASSKNVYFSEHFDDEAATIKRWVKSEAKKQGVDETIAKYDGKWKIEAPTRKILKNDLGLVLTTEAKHAAISALLDKPFLFEDKPLVVQYEVTMQEGQNCGGAYIKLLSKGTDTKSDLRKFFDQTPYTIMFGPDKCGNDNKLHFIFRHQNPKNGTIEEKHAKKPSQDLRKFFDQTPYTIMLGPDKCGNDNKLHFIFRHHNPKNGTIEEKHAKKPSKRLDEYYTDKEPHLYTLIVRPDNTFSILVDNKEVNSGSLLEDFTPPVNPPEEIDDPNDKKPDDWDEREKIVDPSASKPDDWDEDAPAQIVDPNAVKPTGWLDDEPDVIPDPSATKPSDWDDEMDGTWEPPLLDNPRCSEAPGCGPWSPPKIANPDYKGPWRAPLIPNPNYKGKWSPRRVPNPHFFNDQHPFRMTPIHAVGFELWSMSPRLLFDNLIITDDPSVAQQWAEQTFVLKRAKLSKDSDSLIDRFMKFAGENPWIYAVLMLVVLVVIGLSVYCCCGSTSDSDVDPKKTDAYVEDDPHNSEGEGDAEGEGEAEGEEVEEAPERRSKADLEGPHEPDSTETTPLVDTDGAGDGQRKRKPRKE